MLTISSRREAAGRAVAAARTWWRVWSGWAVTAIVVLSYLAWTVPALRQGGPEPFIHLGRTLVLKSQASPAISSRAASYAYDGDIGFDGQYAYFLAVDPINARYYMDSLAYRYTRVLYPMTARVLALGRPDLVPFALIAVNLIMIGVGTGALAALLRRRGFSPWYAAIYGFYPGVLITLQRDTTEIMAYGLVAVAIYLFEARRRWFWSAIVFALAILARETAAIFAIGYAAALLLAGADQGQSPSPLAGEGRGGGWRNAAIFASACALPVLAVRVRAWIWAAAVLWLTPMLFWFALPTLRAYFAVLRHRLGG